MKQERSQREQKEGQVVVGLHKEVERSKKIKRNAKTKIVECLV
jgi:hypothetical protein